MLTGRFFYCLKGRKKMKMTIGFIGAGMTGTALATRLWQRGYPVVAVSSRSLTSAKRLASFVSGCTVCDGPQQVADIASVVFITTPDDVIADIAASIRWRPGQVAVHCSGVHSTDILEPASRYGAHACCLHPLQTFAGIEEAINNIPGSTFAVEGDEAGLAAARGMAQALDGNIILLKAGDKVKYHIAAVTLSNYLVALMKTSADLWQSFGVPQDEAVKALLPLLKGTVRNIERVGIPGCLTGPIARGDVETVRKHMAALEEGHAGKIDIYRVMGLKTLEIARAKGRISLETAEEIRNLLNGPTERPAPYYEDVYKEFDLEYAAGYLSTMADK
jgi:predicted short-subunit dehydrogenase-like oxidoreductase (DUF2520 family)